MAYVPERRETSPVNHVFLFGRTPIPGQEAVSTANDLRVEISGQLGPVICQPSDTQIAAEVRGSEVYVL